MSNLSILGVIDKIIAPKITANGEDVISVETTMALGDKPTCSIRMIPEKIGEVGEYGDKVSIEIESKSFNGVLFDGIIVGESIDSSAEGVVYRVDLAHRIAHELDSSSVFVPGAIASSVVDTETYLKMTKRGASNELQPASAYQIEMGDFWDEVKKALEQHISEMGESDTDLQPPVQIERIRSALGSIKSCTGKWSMGEVALNGVSDHLSQLLRSGSTSSTYMNVLNNFLAQYDLLFEFDMNGDAYVIPNFSGVRSDGKIILDASKMVSLSNSCEYNRTPKKVVVMVLNLPPVNSSGFTPVTQRIGSYDVDFPEDGAVGQLCIEAPRFLRTIASDINLEGFFNQYAALISCREIAKLNLLNVVSPLLPRALPGTPVTIDYEYLVKPYIGSRSSVNSQYDGICRSVSHTIGPSFPPTTALSFASVTKYGKHKQTSHPMWPEGKNPITWKK